MSSNGEHQRDYRADLVAAMSALPLKQTLRAPVGMSVKCQKRTEQPCAAQRCQLDQARERHDRADQHITGESFIRYRYRRPVVWGSYPARRWTIQITQVQVIA
jgi:hypothetical protein